MIKENCQNFTTFTETTMTMCTAMTKSREAWWYHGSDADKEWERVRQLSKKKWRIIKKKEWDKAKRIVIRDWE